MRISGGDEHQYRWTFGTAQFDERSQQLTISGRGVRLEPKPMKLLALFLRHAGEVVTREEILESVWENRKTVDHTISTAVGKLRKALTPACGVEIETVPRAGYRLSGHIKRAAVGRVKFSRLSLEPGLRVRARVDFTLVEQINATKYSDIWLANAESCGTLQVLKFAVDGARLGHLKREAVLNRVLIEALGERDDIARMTDANFSSPPFFLAYEYEGLNLRNWAESSRSFSRMKLSQRLELFQRICTAVAAAHGVGVLHKDIKPENILIQEGRGGDLSVKLGDFGNSELLEPEQIEQLQLTASGLAVTRDNASSPESGTILYMAPELLQTRTATVRSDIYALGMLLYQLIILDFNSTLTPGWQRAIPDPLLVEDIAIATDQEPDRRPSSVEELSNRTSSLEKRHRKLEKQKQRQENLIRSRAELSRQRARRPWVYGMIGSLTLGLVLSLLLYREAENGRQQALNFAENMQAVQRFLSEDVITRASPLGAGYDPDEGLEPILDQAAEQVDYRFENAPQVAAGLHRAFGNVFATFRSGDRAAKHFDRAIFLFQEEFGPRHDLTIQTNYDKARALILGGQYEDGQELLKETDRLASERQMKNGRIAQERAFTYGLLYAGFHDMQPALENFTKARKIFAESGRSDPDLRTRLSFAIVDALIRLNDPDGALLELNTIDIENESGLGADIEPAWLKYMSRVQRDLGETELALEYAERAAAKSTELYGEAHYQSITDLSLLAQLHARMENCSATVSISERVHELMREVYGPSHSGTLIELGNLGAKQFGCGDHDQGISNVRLAVDGLRERFGTKNRALNQFSFFLAKYLHQTGEFEESLEILNALVDRALNQTDGISLTPSELLLWQARALSSVGRARDAASALQRAISYLNSKDAELLEEIQAERSKIGMQ